jgi:hypothetical protein
MLGAKQQVFTSYPELWLSQKVKKIHERRWGKYLHSVLTSLKTFRFWLRACLERFRLIATPPQINVFLPLSTVALNGLAPSARLLRDEWRGGRGVRFRT